jgi:hypothetical protein
MTDVRINYADGDYTDVRGWDDWEQVAERLPSGDSPTWVVLPSGEYLHLAHVLSIKPTR